ncbi:MAG: AAA family ATPase [Negativicutes bacterium]|nr:AAA family ATPase [Negativicutes bacterium]
MASEITFAVGQTIQIKLLDKNNAPMCVSRILAVMPHALTFSLPYDAGLMLLWPIGCRLEISLTLDTEVYSYQTEIIDRDLGEIKSYTVMRPNTISKVAPRVLAKGMSRVIAVTSGKGGVGKTTFTINLAVSLAALGQRTYIIDADLGTANVDVLLHLTAKYNITHLLSGDKSLVDIAIPGPGNITVIPGGSGLQTMTQLKESQFSRLINSLNHLDGLADIILLDTGAGISKDVSNFLLAADEIIVVTTPEPHAITDAYAINKVMHNLNCQGKQMLVVNRAENQEEGDFVAHKLSAVIRQYLQRNIEYIGYILDDRLVSKSLKQQYPFMLSQPQSPPAKNINAIAAKLLNIPDIKPAGMSGFLNKMFSLIQSGKKAVQPSLGQ